MSSNSRNHADREVERASQLPYSRWLSALCVSFFKTGRGFILENPIGSAIWRGPLAGLVASFGKQRCDQCSYGAHHPVSKHPVRKGTGFVASWSLTSSTRWCSGRHEDDILQGGDPKTGLSVTTLACIFPRPLCRALANDIRIFLHTDPRIFWNCVRCLNGNGTAEPHTRIPGQCKQAGRPQRQRRIILPASGVSPPVSQDQWRQLQDQRTDPHPGMPSSGSGAAASSSAPQAPPAPPQVPPASSQAPPAPQDQLAPQAPPDAPSPDDHPTINPDDDQDPAPPLSPMRTTLAMLKTASGDDFMRQVLWLHQKLWHASAPRMLPLLIASGVPHEKLKTLSSNISRCSRCAEYKRHLNMPHASITTQSNEIVQMDCFSWLGHTFVIFLDVTFKFKLADALPDQTFQILCNSFLMTWIRIFGPPKQVHSDQGGNFHGHGFAAFCDKLLIKRVPGGSEAAKPGNILLTGAVEKHTDLLKGTMSKAFADLTDAGHSVDITALLHEACMAHNTLPCYSGVPPISGVLGQPPRDLTDMANERAPLRSKRRTRPTCSSGAFCTASMRARPRSAPSLKRGSPARSMDIHSPWTSELS